MVLWFFGLSLHETKKPVNMVYWFRPLHLWDMEITIGFMVSWFHGFTHSISWTSNAHRCCGFAVSWFRGFPHSISGTSNAHRFRGFMVSWFHGFVHTISGQREANRTVCDEIQNLNETESETFSDTKFFRYRIRYFFRYQIFSKTNTDTFIDTKNFRNRYRYFFRYQIFPKPIYCFVCKLDTVHM